MPEVADKPHPYMTPMERGMSGSEKPGFSGALAVGRLPDNRHLVALPGDRGVVAAIYRKNQHTKKSLQLEIPDIDHQLQLAPP